MRSEADLSVRSAKSNPFERAAEYFLSGCFLLFFGMILLFYRNWTYVVREQLFSTPWFGSLLVIYFSAAALCCLAKKRIFPRFSRGCAFF